MIELERDMAAQERNRWYGLTMDAMENGKHEYVAIFAAATWRAAKRLRSREAAVRNEQRRTERRKLRLRVIEIDRAYGDDNGLRVDMRSDLHAAAMAA